MVCPEAMFVSTNWVFPLFSMTLMSSVPSVQGKYEGLSVVS